MSVPFYYKEGPSMAAEMKRDLHRVRESWPKRYGSRRVWEERTNTNTGEKTKVQVWSQPTSVPTQARERHEMWTRLNWTPWGVR